MAEENAEAAEEAAPVAKVGLVQILIFVVLVGAVNAGVGFMTAGMVKSAMIEVMTADDEEVDTTDLEPANYLPLDPPLVVNFMDQGESRFLQVSVQIMSRDTEVYEDAKIHAPAIRNSLLLLLGTVDYEMVTTREGKEQLQQLALQTADEMMASLAGKSGLDGLFFTNFVVQ